MKDLDSKETHYETRVKTYISVFGNLQLEQLVRRQMNPIVAMAYVDKNGAAAASGGGRFGQLAKSYSIVRSYSIQEGYPGRRRSLVGDAKFEAVKNREAKLQWLKEGRQASQDHTISEDEVSHVMVIRPLNSPILVTAPHRE